MNVSNLACSQFLCLWHEGPISIPINITIPSTVVIAIDVTPLVGTMTNVIGNVRGEI
jgi:hypothetical protein